MKGQIENYIISKTKEIIQMTEECVDTIIIWIKNRCWHQGRTTLYAKMRYVK
jgi:hypothetical protein